MKHLTVNEVASDFNGVLSRIESSKEEVAVLRDNQQVARIVPEVAGQTALQVFGDLYQTLDPDAAEVWSQTIRGLRQQGTLVELRHTWGS